MYVINFHFQILSLPEYATAAKDVAKKMHQVHRKQNINPSHETNYSPGGDGEISRGLDADAAAADAAAVGAEFGFQSREAPSLTTRLDFRRCEDDAKFFEELIEG